MNVFIDANVLIAVLNQEYPRFDLSARVLSLADHKRFNLFVSPLSVSIGFYMCSKKSADKVAYKKINILSDKVSMATNASTDLKTVFMNKQIHDIEDGLQYQAAKASKNKVIVTYNLEDFFFSDIEVLSPQDFLQKYAL